MSYSIELILLIPLATAALSFLMPQGRSGAILSTIGSLLTLGLVVPICYDAFTGNISEYSLWYVDELSALFVLLIAIVGLMVSLYSYGYMETEHNNGKITARDERQYYLFFHLFVAVMILVCVVRSMGILWIAIEATTLISAFLVGFYRNESSTEASWKYLMICSVGITLALVGITLMYASLTAGGGEGALDWIFLYNNAMLLDPDLLKVAFVFIFVGFGTKMGLVPMHTWLPDAHSQAPTPISALLSGVMLNCALYSILRFKMIVDITIPGFSMWLFIGFGLASLLVAAAFIVISKNLKRMLAYSSIEHMGLIAIGFGIGTPLAVFGALFHVMAHSLTKPLVFFSAGNVAQEYGTTDMMAIKGIRKKMPFTSFMLTASTLAIIGLPPFALFVGELSILGGAADAGMYLLIVVVIILIVIVFAGFLRNVFQMLTGDTEKDVKDPKGIVRALPMVLLFAAIILFGLFMPEGMKDAIENIAFMLTEVIP